MSTHEELLNSAIVPWARQDENVTGLAELGSRAHDEPADEWADMDLLVMVHDKTAILDADGWIDAIGPTWVTLRHPGPFPELPVRQVLFEGGLDFDVVPMSAGTLSQELEKPWVRDLFGSGFRKIVDKDGELSHLEAIEPARPRSRDTVAQSEFEFTTRDFLFQVVWAAKHLRRGELWAAKDDVDCYMRARLAQVIEWHAWLTKPGVRTRSGGRHIERWAAPEISERFPATFPSYTPSGVAIALLASLDLFGEIAGELGAALGFNYPQRSHEAIRQWTTDCLKPIIDGSGD